MARKALIIGTPGTGKSTSERTLDPKTTFIINVALLNSNIIVLLF